LPTDHHLADEKRETAGFIFFEGVGGGEVVVEIFERLFLQLGGGGIILVRFPSVAGGGLFCAWTRRLDLVVAAFDGVQVRAALRKKPRRKDSSQVRANCGLSAGRD